MNRMFPYLAAVLVTLAGATSQAQINASAYSVPAAVAETTPTAPYSPGAGAERVATFNAANFNFTQTDNFDLNAFINSGGGITNLTYYNNYDATASLSLVNILFDFTGTALFTNGQMYTVLHDDGVQLYVDGNILLSDPASTSATLTPYTYTGVTGDYDFDFIYTQSYCCGADFITTLVTSTTVVGGATPEPSSIALLATGMLSVAGAVRRRMRKS